MDHNGISDIHQTAKEINTVLDSALSHQSDITEIVKTVDKLLYSGEKPVLICELVRHVVNIINGIQTNRELSFAFVAVHCCSGLLKWKPGSPFNPNIFLTEPDANGYRFYLHTGNDISETDQHFGFGIEHLEGFGLRAIVPLDNTQAFLDKFEEMISWVYQQIQIRRLPEFIQADTVAEIINRLHTIDQRNNDDWKAIGQKCAPQVFDVLI